LTRPNSHLSPEEIDRLSLRPEGHGEDGDSFAESDRHVAGCDVCRTNLRLLRNAQQRLAGLRVGGAGEPGRDCPGDVDWLSVAAGLTNGDEASRLLDHATQCDACGPLLRQAAEDLSGVPATEDSMLASLKSAQPRWQTELARRMSAQATSGAESGTVASARAREFSSVSRRRSWRPAFTWALGLAAALLMAVVAGLMLRNRTGQEFEQRLATAVAPTQPAALLAQAYTEQRDLELRIAGARYAPMNQQRAGRPSRFNRPADLLKAESDLAAAIQRHPDDPSLLAAQARADLLEWDYEAAIQTLKRVEESQPDSASLLTDLASAHFERAEAEGRAIDYGTAIELLGKALDQNPNDPVALYNRAVCYEKMFMYHQATEDWRRYLQIDPKGDWSAAARQHLDAVEEKLKAHDAGVSRRSSDPAVFVSQALVESGRPATESGNQIDGAIEDYLDLAITVWLPQAFPSETTGTPGSVQARRALRILAGQLSARHHDLWLKDMLLPQNPHAFALGVAALSRDVKANQAGEPSEARKEAVTAAGLFQFAGSKAGELRSRVEEVYALQRSLHARPCLDSARLLEPALSERRYSWSQSQVALESGICEIMLGELGKAGEAVDRAVALASSSHYGVLYLRGVGSAAAVETNMGDVAGAWSRDQAGLARYWTGFYPPIRAYQFYSDLAYCAEDQRRWALAAMLWRESVALIGATPNRSGEALARYRLATTEDLAGMGSKAREEFLECERLYSALPQSGTIQTYRFYDGVSLATLEAGQGDAAGSLARLQSLRAELPQIGDAVVALEYYQTLGELHLKRGEDKDAEIALRAAIWLSELAGSCLETNRDRSLLNRARERAYRDLVRLRLRHDATAAVEIWQWYRSAELRTTPAPGVKTGISYAQLDAGPAMPPARLVSTSLSWLEHETVLSYAEFPEGTAIWVFDNRGVSTRWTAVSSVEVDQVASRFVALCADRSSDLSALRREGSQLYRWLIAPVEDRLVTGRTLVIEADDSVARVPLGVLDDGSGRYLDERFRIVDSPGIGYARRPGFEPEFSTSCRVLAVVQPTLSGSMAEKFPALPDAAREGKFVSSLFPNAILLDGPEALPESVQRELPRAAIFHFAGHSFVSADRAGLLLAAHGGAPEESAERFDSVLEISRLRPADVSQCQLAVFSACAISSVSEDIIGGPESLVRGFLRFGVPRVITTRWNVDSAATADLMEAFLLRPGQRRVR
jgi:CHAT domain-containing protein/tetratricopeptide (TPR) repeat protein